MLILTRRIGETLQIGDDITVTVLDAKGTQVKVGVVAPKDVRVLREELVNRAHVIQEETSGLSLPVGKQSEIV